ncbi:hypothetical protein FB451DRAFT_1181942 [Mycena latifolia]|nr:hypothetical protein FB451DRAFT_1181942 [Mycena latifolia]
MDKSYVLPGHVSVPILHNTALMPDIRRAYEIHPAWKVLFRDKNHTISSEFPSLKDGNLHSKHDERLRSKWGSFRADSTNSDKYSIMQREAGWLWSSIESNAIRRGEGVRRVHNMDD